MSDARLTQEDIDHLESIEDDEARGEEIRRMLADLFWDESDWRVAGTKANIRVEKQLAKANFWQNVTIGLMLALAACGAVYCIDPWPGRSNVALNAFYSFTILAQAANLWSMYRLRKMDELTGDQ